MCTGQARFGTFQIQKPITARGIIVWCIIILINYECPEGNLITIFWKKQWVLRKKKSVEIVKDNRLINISSDDHTFSLQPGNQWLCLSQRATAWWWEVAALQQSVQSELPGQADAADYQGPSPGQQHWTWLHSHHKRTPAGQGRRCRYMGACFFAFVHAPWSTVHFVFMLALQIATCFIQQQDRFMLSLFLSLCSLSYTHTHTLCFAPGIWMARHIAREATETTDPPAHPF